MRSCVEVCGCSHALSYTLPLFTLEQQTLATREQFKGDFNWVKVSHCVEFKKCRYLCLIANFFLAYLCLSLYLTFEGYF